MNIEKENNEVFYVKNPIVCLGVEEVDFLKERVMLTKRKTIRLCMHKSIEESIHEMLILHSRETYIRPHKHPNKNVSYHIIEGIADMVVFDDNGGILDVTPIGEYGTGRHYFYRLNEVYYYTPLVYSDFLLFHETMNGPFKPSDTVYASWAASQNSDPVVINQYREELTSKVKEFMFLKR